MSELLSLTLRELTDALHSKRASPVELMQSVFARVDARNPELNAVVAERGRDELLSEARASEARLARGEGRVLEGIPFGVKDLEDAFGLPTSHGSKAFAGGRPERDSTQVARLRAAGAILYGKTNAPEFGTTAVTKNLVFGATRSPWDASRTPGGSSGGSAAALASEMLPLVTASDGGGSIRIPASFVGAFGLKPSYGRVPRGPSSVWEHGATIAYGPLTKTVEDGALFLDVVAGYSADDPMSLPKPTSSFLDAALRGTGRKLKIAFSPDLGYAVVQSDVLSAVESGVRVLEKLGHQVTLVSGGPPEMNGDWALLSVFDIATRLSSLSDEQRGQLGRGLVESMGYVSTMSRELWTSISQKRAQLAAYCASIFADYDLLVTPTVPYDPPPAKGPFPSETEGRMQITASVASFTIPFNLSWNPAGTVRTGLSRAGFPVGLQFVAPHHEEARIFSIAREFEREMPAHPHWPLRRSA